MSDSAFLLLHSPLLGPASWYPARDELTARAERAVVPNLVDAVTGRGPHIPAIARSVRRAIDGVGQPITLVAHSGASALVPDAHHLSGYAEPARVVTALESLLADLRAGR